jgi:hypothetical protein
LESRLTLNHNPAPPRTSRHLLPPYRSRPLASAADAAAAPSFPRHVVRLSSALAALLDRAGGAELSEDELLLRLKEAGLITYPSPLLARLLQELPDVLAADVLARLDPADRTSLAAVARMWRDAAYPISVFPTGLPRAEKPGAARILNIVGCLGPSSWAKETGCPWVARTFALAAVGGQLEVLKLARAQDCPWDETCARAALGGELETL